MVEHAALRNLAVLRQAPAQERGSAREAIGRFLDRMKRLAEPPGTALKAAMDVHVPREVAADHLNRKFAGRPPIFDLRQ
ncbi:MAG: hypothetical protein AB1295_04895 [Candidatus Micrarchaeota archaeon]